MSDNTTPAAPQPAAAPSATAAAPGPAAPAPEPPKPLALAAAALNAAGVMWIEAPGDQPRPCWFAWVAGAATGDSPGVAYVVNGPGEQDLPWLPEQVTLILKSKDTGGRLTKVTATAEKLDPGSDRWQAAADSLASGRLNSTDDVQARWREQCTITALTPVGTPLESPTDPDTYSGATQIVPSPATTGHWHPWHIAGRAKTARARRFAKARKVEES